VEFRPIGKRAFGGYWEQFKTVTRREYTDVLKMDAIWLIFVYFKENNRFVSVYPRAEVINMANHYALKLMPMIITHITPELCKLADYVI
jgi:hypothetical protein